ncbi:hypothetical protein G5714_002749 [Onychostoma macrolepis]|uniref:Uncharacterized protein n=1 Tax=Onychostoma macrolepis TaxID=369639 RepID=A0A7J6D7N4_9TELE|nr:hypothetical protein G5714_002749 [Onychostoma macrolepis]
MEMEKRQIAISSSSKTDKGTFPKDTPVSESSACYQEDSNRSTRSESPACKGETLTDQPSSESLAQRGRRHTGICNMGKLQRANLHSKDPLVLQEISILQRFVFKAVETDSCSFPTALLPAQPVDEVTATGLLTRPQRT